MLITILLNLIAFLSSKNRKKPNLFQCKQRGLYSRGLITGWIFCLRADRLHSRRRRGLGYWENGKGRDRAFLIAEYKSGQNTEFNYRDRFQELLRIVRIFWETYRYNSREFVTFTCIHRLSTRNRIPPPLVFNRPFSTVECSLGYNQYLLF